MKAAADEIRFAGNEVAHGDLVAEPISEDDADEIISLMDTILERIYQEPAQIARIRAKREARSAATIASEEAAPTADTASDSDEPPF
jgi:hypothetical protein